MFDLIFLLFESVYSIKNDKLNFLWSDSLALFDQNKLNHNNTTAMSLVA